MSDFLDAYGQQLRRAAALRVAESPSSRSRRRSRPAVAAAWALLVAVAATAAATTPWSPLLGQDGNGPQRATSTIPADERAVLAVLRRPQTQADRGSDVEALLKALISTEEHGIRLEGIRRLADGPTPDSAVVLIPQEHFGSPKSGSPDALCVYYPNPSTSRSPLGVVDSSAVKCSTLPQILRGDADGLAPVGRGWTYYGLVPDGVATVVIGRRDGSTVTARVVNNFVAIPGSDHDQSPTAAEPVGPVRWLDGAGQSVGPPLPPERR